MKVTILDHTGAKRTPADLPDEVPMRQLIPALVTKMSLPTMQSGQPVTYELDHKRSGKRLGENDTLKGAGVQDDDILTLLPKVIAGAGGGNPRLRRLQSDYERLQRLLAVSNLIRMVTTEGYPPEKYLIELTCRGVARVNGNQPVYADDHQVGIYLPAGYPTTKPSMKWMTPIFHPNISPNGAVCIGAWYASKWLDELVYMLAEMVQYKNFDDNPTNVLNIEAADWSRQHRHLFPVDRREIKTMGEGTLISLIDQIKIGDQAGPEIGEDILGKIVLG